MGNSCKKKETQDSPSHENGSSKNDRDPLLPSGGAAAVASPKRLSMWGLAFMTYFAVCGGPFGLEPAVKAGYPFYFIIGMVLIPWIWSLPIALMTAELSTALPQSGGFVVWVKEAFGPFMAHQEAWWSFVNNLFDLSIYPVMCENYIASLVELQPYQAYLVRFSVLTICFILNLFGVDVVSKISGFFLILVLTPFALIMGFGIKHIRPADWWQVPPEKFTKINWGLFLTTIVWSTGGFDNMSQVSSELENPKKSYPRAMVLTLFAMIITTILPFLVAFSVAPNYHLWHDGYWAQIAFLAAGDWLRIVLVVGAIISSLSILNAYLCTCSEMLAAWGEPDLLGISILKTQSRWKTPWVAILINSLLIAVGTLMPFEFLVQMDQLFYSLGLILEYLSLVKLRFSQPDLHRPYKIPLNKWLLIVFITLPLIFCGFTTVTPLISNWKIAVITAGCLVFGGISYPALRFIQKCVGIAPPQVESGIN